MSSKISTITVLGSSSGRNAGDAALVSGLMDSIDEACQRKLTYEIPTIRPGYIRDNYENNTIPVGMMPWNLSVKMLGLPTLNSMMRTDLSLVFDAVLFDRSLWNPLFNFMSSIALMAPIAKRAGRKLGCYNVGLGPVTSVAGRRMLKNLLEKMDFIAVREESSLELLGELGVQNPNVVLGADAALTVRASSQERVDEILKQSAIPLDSEFLAFNVNTYINTWADGSQSPLTRNQFIETYSNAVSQVAQKLKVPVVFVATQHSDVELTEQVRTKVSSPAPVAIVHNKVYNHYDIKGVLGRASLLFGMRLHSQILASSELTPIIGLAFQNKVEHYYRTLGLPEYSMPFSKFTTSNLVEHILKGWNDRSSLKLKLGERIPQLQKRALIAPKVVAALAAGQSIDKYLVGNAGSDVDQKIAAI